MRVYQGLLCKDAEVSYVVGITHYHCGSGCCALAVRREAVVRPEGCGSKDRLCDDFSCRPSGHRVLAVSTDRTDKALESSCFATFGSVLPDPPEVARFSGGLAFISVCYYEVMALFTPVPQRFALGTGQAGKGR